MSKRKPSREGPEQTPQSAGAKSARRSRTDRKGGAPADHSRWHVPTRAAIRETVETLVTTLLLVFLIQTFEVRAFVIPTGSLAPTLSGRHKDVVCPQCGYRYLVSASGEVDTNTQVSRGPAYRVQGCTCPMCRYPTDLGPDNPQQESYPSLGGERILASKLAYQVSEPRRWDIAPFKYPGGAATDYIKRIVGLPEETVRISHGDLFIRGPGEQEFAIARKPPKTLLSMSQAVYDNDHVAPKIMASGWPARWQPWPAANFPSGGHAPHAHPDRQPGGWVVSADNRWFQTDGSSADATWLRYQHFVPSYRDWQDLLAAGRLPVGRRPRPHLIADFCAYNTARSRQSIASCPEPGLEGRGLHWVGDLIVQCTLEVQGSAGQAVFELVEGGRSLRCSIDVATGRASLSIDGLDSFRPSAVTNIRGPGSHEITLSNVDDQLMLWVDGTLIAFDAPTAYRPLGNTRPRPADLAPVGIASSGAALRVGHLKLFRDVYYIAQRRHQRAGLLTDFDNLNSGLRRLTPDEVARFLSDPRRWDAFEGMHSVEFPLGADQFLMLGDNSPCSKDSRLWELEGFEYYVSRELLVGKALLVHWPHSPKTVPGTGIPFFPNVSRIRLVR